MTQKTLSRGLILGAIAVLTLPSWGSGIELSEGRAIASAPANIGEERQVARSSARTASFVWPTRGTITQEYRQGHRGIDIAGAMGTPILAAKGGEVVYAEWDSLGLGNAIKLKHADGTYTVYGHNQRLWVRKGQRVQQGEAIAAMGSTGNSTGPHLHFELRLGDRPRRWLDPLDRLPPLVAGKIPPQRLARAVSGEGSCTPLLEGETARFRVQLCEDGGEFFYIGQFKHDPDRSLRLRARYLGGDRYLAENGSYSYRVNATGVEVWYKGRKLRSERFL